MLGSRADKAGPAGRGFQRVEMDLDQICLSRSPECGGMLLFKVAGSALSQPVQLTLPNTDGYKPGAVLTIYLVNMITGGHDAVGEMVVSADGTTMTSTGSIHIYDDRDRELRQRR